MSLVSGIGEEVRTTAHVLLLGPYVNCYVHSRLEAMIEDMAVGA